MAKVLMFIRDGAISHGAVTPRYCVMPPNAGCFVGMETAPVAPWPHQKIVACRLVETRPYTYLLCDEVGLGKTIELDCLRSLYLSGLVKVLVAAPASLTDSGSVRWQQNYCCP